jgi:hypothetical protein
VCHTSHAPLTESVYRDFWITSHFQHLQVHRNLRITLYIFSTFWLEGCLGERTNSIDIWQHCRIKNKRLLTSTPTILISLLGSGLCLLERRWVTSASHIISSRTVGATFEEKMRENFFIYRRFATRSKQNVLKWNLAICLYGVVCHCRWICGHVEETLTLQWNVISCHKTDL